MLDINEEQKKVGKKGLVEMYGKLKFEVIILKVQNFYGNIRYCVKPVAGTGEHWVENLEIIKTK